MALFLGQDLNSVGRIPVSRIDGVYESESFKVWKQKRDHDAKLPGAILGRMDGLAKLLQSSMKARPR